MNVSRMSYTELSLFLSRKGLSDTGQKSITDNEITGQMLLEFCEEDIQDAFSVFKDRFTIRKVLREHKTSPTETQPNQTISTTRFQSQTIANPNQTQQNQNMLSKNYDHRFSPSMHSEQVPNKHLPSQSQPAQTFSHSQHSDRIRHQPVDRSVISLVSSDVSNPIPLQIHKNQAFEPVSSVVRKNDNLEFQSSANELMNERVSSTDEYRQQRRSYGNKEDTRNNIYECAVDALVSLSNKHSSKDTSSIEHPVKNVPVSPTSTGPSQTFQLARQNSNSQSTGDTNIYGLNYDCTYAWNIMSQKVKSLSADELLSKRSRFSKPTEAQRLGGILIRNAAHSAGVWKDAPCLHEISLQQRKEFFKFIVSLAPQLSNSQPVLFTRLREALQNRRKYLLDKKLGKIQKRRKREPEDLNLEISEPGSFIDLTDFSGELEEVDDNSEDFNNDVYIKPN